MRFRLTWTIAALPVLSLGAQLPPVHQLGPITASVAEFFGMVPSVRALSGGRLLVSDPIRRRLVLFDTTLRAGTVVLDESSSTNGALYPQTPNGPNRGGGLIPGQGDTTYFLDLTSSSFVVIDGAGKVARVTAVPRTSDLTYIANPSVFGQARIDPSGRLIYRRDLRPIRTGTTVVFPDSVQIVAVNFDTRKADTLAYIHVPPFNMRPTQKDDADGITQMTMSPPPFDMGDDWVALADGSVALIREQDYHIDWIDPNGARRSSPKVAWPWKRLDDDAKSLFVDSLKRVYARADTELNGQVAVQLAGGMGRPGQKVNVTAVPYSASEIPDYPPPFMPRLARVDFKNRIWLPERGAAAVRPDAIVYDIIDKTGQIVDRVQVPAPYTIAAIGDDGSVYLTAPTQPSVLPAVLGSTFMNNMPAQPLTKLARATYRPR